MASRLTLIGQLIKDVSSFQVLSTHIDESSAHLIVKYLSSKRPFFSSFNIYLADILKVIFTYFEVNPNHGYNVDMF